VVDSPDWYAWLQTASTFTFHSEQGSFTAHKERAGNRRGRPYWRAYHTWKGKLHRAYLGQSEELTLDRLKAAAALLSDPHTGTDAHARKKKEAALLISRRMTPASPLHPSERQAVSLPGSYEREQGARSVF
jgi:hypothetical protein